MALATLSVDLVAKLARFEGDMGKAARAVEATKARIESAASAMTTTFAALGAGIAVDQMLAFTLRTIDGIDALNDMADATGSTVENMSALEDVARRTGTNVATVTDAVVKFNGVLADAKPGSKYADMLKAIGLSADELKRLDPAEALVKTAKALSTFADDGSKARVVQDLFGRSVKEIAPLLKDLADQGELNATVTKEQAEQAERFNKQLAAMKANFEDSARAVAGSFLPGLHELSEVFAAAARNGDTLIDKLRLIARTRFTADGLNLPQDIEDARQRVADLEDDLRRYQRSGPADTSGIEQALSKAKGDLKYFRDLQLSMMQFTASDESSAEKRRLGIQTSSRPSIVVPETDKKKKKEKDKPPVDEAEKYYQSLTRQLEAMQKLSVEEALLRDISLGRLGTVSEAQRARLVDIAQEIDAEKQFAELQKQFSDLEKEAEERRLKLQQEAAAVYEATRTPLERLNIEQARLNDLLAKGAISWDTYSRAVFDAQDAYDETTKKTEKLDTFGQRAAQRIQDSLGDTFVDAMNGKFDGIADGFVQMLNRMVAEAAAAQLARYLFGDMVEGGTGAGAAGSALKWFGSLLSFDGGGSTGSGARTGGLDGKGGFLALLHPQESVLDHTKGQSNGAVSGGTTIIQLTVQAPPGGTRATALQWGRDAMDGMLLARSRNG